MLQNARKKFILAMSRIDIGYQINCTGALLISQKNFFSKTYLNFSRPSPKVELTDVAAVTTCELECDCLVSEIMNSSIVHANIGDCEMINPGLRFIWRDEMQRHKQRGEKLKSIEVRFG